MEKGTLSERHLTNAVLRNVRKIDKDAVAGAGIGNDFGGSFGGSTYRELSMNEFVHKKFTVGTTTAVSADGTGQNPCVAWNKAMNNFLCSAGHCHFARLLIFLPENTKESRIKAAMEELDRLAVKHGVQIIGGQTEVLSEISKPRYAVTLFGEADISWRDKKKIDVGDDIVMIGYAGSLGNNLLLEENKDFLYGRLSKQYLDRAAFGEDELSVWRAVTQISGEIETGNISYVHDISGGGVYLALWQLHLWINKSITADNRKIPIKQETVEICEALNQNPYLIDGTGGLLVVCKDGRKLLNISGRNDAAIIGKVTDETESFMLINDSEKRTLAP